MFRGIVGGPRIKKPKPFVRRVNLPQEESEDLIPAEEPEEKIEIITPEEIIVEEAPIFQETTFKFQEKYQSEEKAKTKRTYRKKSKKKRKPTVASEQEQ